MSKSILTESTKSKFKVLEHKPANVLKRIQGVLSDFKSNRNGRKYPRELWQNVLNSDYVKEMIESHGLVGELDHPETRLEISLQNVSHVINDMWIEGDQVLGTIDILPTPSGKIVSELLDYGTDIGISSRGAGTVLSDDTVDPSDYQFVTFDFVARPSCEAARLNMIVEGVQTEIDNNSDDKVKSIIEGYKTGLKENDTKGMAGAFNILNNLADDNYMERLKAIRKTLSNNDAEGLDMVLDDISVNPKTCALEDLEDAVHESVSKYNEANSFDEYENEEFYGKEYNANNIYAAIVKLFGRDTDLEKSLGYRPKWLDESNKCYKTKLKEDTNDAKSIVKSMLEKDGEVLVNRGMRKVVVTQINEENFNDMPDMLIKQLKKEHKLNYWIDILVPTRENKPYSYEHLPIFGDDTKYVTKWFSSTKEKAIKRLLNDKELNVVDQAVIDKSYRKQVKNIQRSLSEDDYYSLSYALSIFWSYGIDPETCSLSKLKQTVKQASRVHKEHGLDGEFNVDKIYNAIIQLYNRSTNEGYKTGLKENNSHEQFSDKDITRIKRTLNKSKELILDYLNNHENVSKKYKSTVRVEGPYTSIIDEQMISLMCNFMIKYGTHASDPYDTGIYINSRNPYLIEADNEDIKINDDIEESAKIVTDAFINVKFRSCLEDVFDDDSCSTGLGIIKGITKDNRIELKENLTSTTSSYTDTDKDDYLETQLSKLYDEILTLAKEAEQSQRKDLSKKLDNMLDILDMYNMNESVNDYQKRIMNNLVESLINK